MAGEGGFSLGKGNNDLGGFVLKLSELVDIKFFLVLFLFGLELLIGELLESPLAGDGCDLVEGGVFDFAGAKNLGEIDLGVFVDVDLGLFM